MGESGGERGRMEGAAGGSACRPGTPPPLLSRLHLQPPNGHIPPSVPPSLLSLSRSNAPPSLSANHNVPCAPNGLVTPPPFWLNQLDSSELTEAKREGERGSEAARQARTQQRWHRQARWLCSHTHARVTRTKKRDGNRSCFWCLHPSRGARGWMRRRRAEGESHTH